MQHSKYVELVKKLSNFIIIKTTKRNEKQMLEVKGENHQVTKADPSQ